MSLFRIHLGGVALTNLADGVIAGALPLIAVLLTRDPQLIGLLSGAMWMPWLIGALVIGVVVDRADRARLRVVALTARLVVLAIAGGLVFTGHLTIWVLIGLVVAYAVTEVFSDLAAAAMVPQLVPRSDLPRANSRVLGAERLMQAFVGGPLGGALFVFGAGWVFGVAAALVAATVLLLALGLRRPEGFRPARAAPSSFRSEIGEGLRIVLHHPVVRPLTVMSAVTNLANTAYFSVFVLWVVGPDSAVGLQPWQFPLLLAALSVGAVAASVLPSRWLLAPGEMRMMMGCWIVNTALLLVPWLIPQVWAITTAFLAIGATNMVGNTLSASIRQRVVAHGALGRVGGAARTLGYGTMAVAGPMGGFIAAQWGIPVLFASMTALAMAGTLWAAVRVDQALVDEHELGEDSISAG